MSASLPKNGYSIVVGMGATGYSIAKFLASKKQLFVVYDTRNNPQLGKKFSASFADVELYFGDIPNEVIENSKDIILSPGVSKKESFVQIAIDSGKPVYGDIDLFLKHCSKPIIGITGSNGKSTLVTLVGKVLENAGYKPGVGGNIGTPALDLLGSEYDVYVLELSSFQLETVRYPSFDVACIINVSEDHMDRYDSMDEYVKAKHRIYRGANKVVFSAKDHQTYPADDVTLQRVSFCVGERSEKPYADYYLDLKDGFIKSGERMIIHKDEVLLKGFHNIENALALFCIAKHFGFSEHVCAETLRVFRGLPHRCEFVAEVDGITFINDSKATNVGAAKAAIEGLAREYQGLYLIAGGDGKGADFSEFGAVISQYVKRVLLIGRDAKLISSTIDDAVSVDFVDSFAEAVIKAKESAKESTLVLLSPACASFDMFDGFEDRGEKFTAAVREVMKC